MLRGTPQHYGPSLCETCRHATIARGVSLDQEIIECSELNGPDRRVRFRVVTCSAYTDRRRPSLSAMSDIAWELRTDRSGQRIGFVSPDDAHKLDKGRVRPLRTLRDPFNDDF